MKKCDKKNLSTFYISLIATMTGYIQQGIYYLIEFIIKISPFAMF